MRIRKTNPEPEYGIIRAMDYEAEDELVTLGECDSEQELIVVRGLLESAGIECLCPALTWNAGLSERLTVLPFAVLVRKKDLTAARQVLDASQEVKTDSDENGDH